MMVVPSYSYVLIALTAVDADSPLDETLMTQVVKNAINAQEQLSDGYVAAKDHDHDDVNSKAVVTVAAGAIDTTELAANAVTTSILKTDAVTNSSFNIGAMSSNTPAAGLWTIARRSTSGGTPQVVINSSACDEVQGFGLITDGGGNNCIINNNHAGNADNWDYTRLA